MGKRAATSCGQSNTSTGPEALYMHLLEQIWLIVGLQYTSKETDRATRWRQEAEGRGASRAAVSTIREVGINAYMNSLKTIDLALDPFEVSGATTSLDLMWAGTPTMGHRGSSNPSLFLESVLHSMGMSVHHQRMLMQTTTKEYEDACLQLINA